MYDILIDGAQDAIKPSDLPGFQLSLVFTDNSSLDITLRLALDNTLADVQVAAVTGLASEVLGAVVKDRKCGLLAELVPLTEGERKVLMAANKQAAGAQLQRAVALCRELRGLLCFTM